MRDLLDRALLLHEQGKRKSRTMVRERGTRLLKSPEDLEKDPVAAHILRTAGVRK